MMFKAKQSVALISGVKVGGQPGENPTVVILSIFYDGHRIVSNPVVGEFDKRQAETLISQAEELSDRTGNPLFIDVMATTADALTRYIEFVTDQTSVPFLVDSISREAKLQAVMYIQKVGLTEKAIYNSINFLSTPQELAALRDAGVKSAVLLAYDSKGNRETVLPDLLKAAEGAGIENVLVDTAVLQVSSIGTASKAIYQIKEKFGLPAGCAPANVISIWKMLKTGEFGPDARKVCFGASTLYTQMMGANFVIAGPIDYADAVFPAVAMADAIIAAEAHNLGVKIAPEHPLFRIF